VSYFQGLVLSRFLLLFVVVERDYSFLKAQPLWIEEKPLGVTTSTGRNGSLVNNPTVLHKVKTLD
jgi:hypothetical protein